MDSKKRSKLWRVTVRPLGRLAVWLITCVLFPVMALPIALASRFLARRTIDVGLGPDPLINNVYHKIALTKQGYSAETFVDHVYYVTDRFDYRCDLLLKGVVSWARRPWLFVRSLFRYRAVYLYFNGGPLGTNPILWRFEPLLFRLAGVRVLVMPYGGDVQEMSRSNNLLFKHTLSLDYPQHRFRRERIARLVDVWTRNADHIISGVEWVDYMYHWDTVMLGHFSIDCDQWAPSLAEPCRSDSALRILHAPNHRAIKGTEYFVRAVEELKKEGLAVELVLLEGVSNEVVRQKMEVVDVIADQLVIGWYAMFAIEGMAMGKPVLCYLRQDLIEFYTALGLIEPDEIPIVNTTVFTVKETIRWLAKNRDALPHLGRLGREFVCKHHSLDVVGEVLAAANARMGIEPRGTSDREQ